MAEPGSSLGLLVGCVALFGLLLSLSWFTRCLWLVSLGSSPHTLLGREGLSLSSGLCLFSWFGFVCLVTFVFV